MEKNDTILILENDLNNGVCRFFANELADGLALCGCNTDIRCPDTMTPAELEQLVKNEYRAIIGFGTNFFTAPLPLGGYLGELGNFGRTLKFHLLLDSPTYLREVLDKPISNMIYLMHDEQDMEVVKRYYPHIDKISHFPLGGSISGDSEAHFDSANISLEHEYLRDRIYDVTFIGSGGSDVEKVLHMADDASPGIRKLTLGYFEYMLTHPHENSGEAFFNYLHDVGVSIEDDRAAVLQGKLWVAEKAVSIYYRNNVISKIADRGIEIHIFGMGDKTVLAGYRNIHISGPVDYLNGLNIMSRSKISLNVMNWHKGAMTERVANIMLNGAVCATDSTSYIDRSFQDDKDMLIYDITDADKIGDRIAELLGNDEKRLSMAEQGFRMAYDRYRWVSCAKNFLVLLRKYEENRIQAS